MSVSRLLRSRAPYQGLVAEALTKAPSSAARCSLAAVAVRSGDRVQHRALQPHGGGRGRGQRGQPGQFLHGLVRRAAPAGAGRMQRVHVVQQRVAVFAQRGVQLAQLRFGGALVAQDRAGQQVAQLVGVVLRAQQQSGAGQVQPGEAGHEFLGAGAPLGHHQHALARGGEHAGGVQRRLGLPAARRGAHGHRFAGLDQVQGAPAGIRRRPATAARRPGRARRCCVGPAWRRGALAGGAWPGLPAAGAGPAVWPLACRAFSSSSKSEASTGWFTSMVPGSAGSARSAKVEISRRWAMTMPRDVGDLGAQRVHGAGRVEAGDRVGGGVDRLHVDVQAGAGA